MAIKVGQLRYNQNTSYLTPLSNVIIGEQATTVGNTSFNDLAIKAFFQAGVTYYIRIDIERININTNMGNSGSGINDPHYQNIEVKLYANNTNQYQTIGDVLVIEPYKDEDEDDSIWEKEENFLNWCRAAILDRDPNIDLYDGAKEYYNNLLAEHQQKKNNDTIDTNIRDQYKVIELIFTPYVNSNILVFELCRLAYDYNGIGEPRKVKINTINYDIANVQNILPTNVTIEKVGLQTKPGSYVIINGEGMRVGKSGVLEINSGIPITSIGLAAPGASSSSDRINDFLLDYIYTE